jgi:hypothetical protein
MDKCTKPDPRRHASGISRHARSLGLWRPQFLSPTWLNNFPFRPLTLLSFLSGCPEQAGTDFFDPRRHARHGAGYQASTPDMVSGIRISQGVGRRVGQPHRSKWIKRDFYDDSCADSRARGLGSGSLRPLLFRLARRASANFLILGRRPRSIFGRPTLFRDFQRQNALKPARCHRRMVSG